MPLLYITGTKDWLIYRQPGSIAKMSDACADFRGVKWIEDAGQWVQQEQSETLGKQILEFLGKQ